MFGTVPRYVDLAGHRIRTRRSKKIDKALTECHAQGLAKLELNEIWVSTYPELVGSGPEKESIPMQTYVHELVHFILYYMAENKLCMNEKFVDQFSQLLFQALEGIRRC